MTMFRDDTSFGPTDAVDGFRVDRPQIDLTLDADLEPPSGLRRNDVEPGFAERSAAYLASCGLNAADVERALIDQLGLRPSAARRIVGDSLDWFPAA